MNGFGKEQSSEASQSLEVNILSPFLSDGISEFRYLAPIAGSKLTMALSSNYVSKLVSHYSHGEAKRLSTQFGYRQYFNQRWHAEGDLILNFSTEKNRPPFNASIKGFSYGLVLLLGHEWELSQRLYLNLRAGLSIDLHRSRHYVTSHERMIPLIETTLGVYF